MRSPEQSERVAKRLRIEREPGRQHGRQNGDNAGSNPAALTNFMNCQATIYSGNGCDCDRCQDGKLPEASPVWDEREEQPEKE